MQSCSQASMNEFKIQAALCSQAVEGNDKPELLTQEQSQSENVDSFGIEEELFQEDDKATMLPTLDFAQSVS